ncbi:chemotaxis protein CheV [mine drainage metagenome]|jgi:two-component system, chemotaxis family, chemotaxis protein CheV|uniref:Chemotaxis protein CheV n=1 Tax=mine drainage metagenome TaxID=410659 RepID=A0A1J5Q9S7_9ZZZZ
MSAENNSTLLDAIDARTKLAGSNKMEILLFSLGSHEIFGINVFKVREVTNTPKITKTPNVPQGVRGFISLRGNIIPVIALSQFINAGESSGSCDETLIVTEFSRHTQGFLVHSVDRIIRVDWDKVKPPQDMLAGNEGLITAITELPDGRLISILDVEQLLASALGESPIPELARLSDNVDRYIFFADDSQVARKNIVSVLDRMTIKYQQANNGLEAWEKLKSLAARAQQDGRPLYETLRLILTDAEMPEMDGYVLTKNIKSDRRFDGIPIVMHSSLSSQANKTMGMQAGVDAYVPKFDAVILSETLRPLLV